MNSSSSNKSRQANYTCQAEIKKNVMQGIAVKSEALGGAQPQGGQQMIDNWVKFVTQKAEDEGRLMTTQQYSDWSMCRRLTAGDRVRYIGPDREEVSLDGGRSLRPNGQIGIVADVSPQEDGAILTIYPTEPVMVALRNGKVEEKIVNLQVKVGTRAWLALERIPL